MEPPEFEQSEEGGYGSIVTGPLDEFKQKAKNEFSGIGADGIGADGNGADGTT